MSEKSEKKTGKTKKNGKLKEQPEEIFVENGEEEADKTRQLNTKALPAILMLLGGAVSSIVTFINRYSLEEMLPAVLISMIVFYLIGIALKKLFDSLRIVVKEEKEASDEGEVIEKEPLSEGAAGSGGEGKVKEK